MMSQRQKQEQEQCQQQQREVPEREEYTSFVPFHADKISQLPFKGTDRRSQVEIAETLGPPKVMFRRKQTPSTESPRTSPVPPRERRVSQAGAKEASTRARPPGPTTTALAPKPPQLQVVMEPSSRVTKSVVLNRIGDLKKDQDTDNDLKRYWMPDKACRECSECQTRFNILVRRHHCRICGRIFCNACCSHMIPGFLLRRDLQGNLRVCKECLDIFQEFYASKLKPDASNQPAESQPPESPLPTRSASGTSSLTPQKPQPDLPQTTSSPDNPMLRGVTSGSFGRNTRPISVLSPHKSWDDASLGRSMSQEVELSPSSSKLEFDNPLPFRRLSNQRNKSYDSLRVATERDERLLALGEDEVEFAIHEVWQQLTHPSIGLQPQSHRYRLRTFPNSLSAHSIVEWLLKNRCARSREVALRVGQALVDTKRLRVISSLDPTFKDETSLYLDYGDAATIEPESSSPPTVTDAPKWFQHLPEDGDSEFEVSNALSFDSNQLKVRYSQPPSLRSDSFIDIQPFQEPTIVVSSISQLTGIEGGEGVASLNPDRATLNPDRAIKDDAEEDYLVINPEGGGDQEDENSDPRRDENPIMMPPGGLSLAITSPVHTKMQSVSFAMVDNQEVLKALPVSGLSSAAQAAKDLEGVANNGEPKVKSNEEARVLFEMEHDHHFDALMIQLLKSFGLPLNWLRTIKPLVMEASHKVKTNIFVEDVMDINHYVKVKKIPGGRKRDSTLVYGVVCSRNITHKKMTHSVQNPTILLLKCAFEFQRKENQLSSFDTLQLQEEKYLKNLVARVKTFRPSVILVQKSVSRLALEMLYELGIVVAVNMKPSVMTRVARSTQGNLLHSLDQLFFDVHLGTCGHFYIRNFTLPGGMKKTLMYFDSCDPKLGCVITLAGGTNRELKKVKKVTRFGLHIAHNSHLEVEFLIDEFAWPASVQPRLLPDMQDYSSTPSTPEWLLYPSLAYPIQGISPTELHEKLALLAPEVVNQEEPQSMQKDETTGSSQSSSDHNSSQSCLGNQNAPVPNGDKGLLGDTGAVIQAVEEQAAEREPQPKSSSTTSFENRSTLPSEEVLCQLGEREFSVALQKQIISISPDVEFPAPYLQTAQGRAASIRQFLPKVIYWSYHFRTNLPSRRPSMGENQRMSLHYATTPVEMGISKALLAKEFSTESNDSQSEHQVNGVHLEISPQFQHSYTSVSDHPFTKSIFLLRANTSEMKAALADYRSQAGLLGESDNFFFQSAKVASDYQLHLQNVFNKYQPFESEANAIEGKSEKVKESAEAKTGETSNGKPVKRRARRQKIPGKTKAAEPISSSDSSSLRVNNSTQSSTENGQSSLARSVTSSSKRSEESGSDTAGAPKDKPVEFKIGGGESTRSDQEETFADVPHRVLKAGAAVSKIASKESVTSKLSEKFGTLEYLDRDHSKPLCEEDEDNLETALEEWNYDSWLISYQQVDCLDPCNHQGISIVFSSTCHDGHKHQIPCVPPCIIPMNYYGRNDISLGEFLQRYCFRPYYRCQTCGAEMTKHQRHVVHRSRALHISMQQIDTSIPGGDDNIFTWLACRHCTQCTPYVQLSANSLMFSFAKFLELKFYCSSYVTRYHSDGRESDCPHTLHEEYVHYFCHRNKIVAFQPASISILEVCIPPKTIRISTPHSDYHHDYVAEIKHVQRILEGVFYRIKQRLLQYNMEPVTTSVKEHIDTSKAERDTFRNKVKRLKDLVVAGGFLETGVPSREGCSQMVEEDEEEELLFSLQDAIAELKRSLTEVVECWNIHMESLDATVRAYRSRKDHITSTMTTDGSSPRASPLSMETEGGSQGVTPTSTPYSTPFGTPPGVSPSSSPDLSHSGRPFSGALSSDSSTTTTPTQLLVPQMQRQHSRNLSDSIVLSREGSSSPSGLGGGRRSHKRQLSDSTSMRPRPEHSEESSGKREELEPERLHSVEDISSEGHSSVSGRLEPSSSESDTRGAPPSLKDSREHTPADTTLPTDGFQLPEDGTNSGLEYQRIKTFFDAYYSQPGKGESSGRGSSLSGPGEESSHNDTGVGIFAKLRGKDAEPREDPGKYYLVDPMEVVKNSPLLGVSANHSTQEHRTHHHPVSKSYHRRPGTIPRRNVNTTALSSTEASGDAKGREGRVVRERGVLARPFQKLPPPFELNEHHNMHKSLKIPIAIYEKEPTSIIAYALSSQEYAQKMKILLEKKRNASWLTVETQPPQPVRPRSPPKHQFSEPEKSFPPLASSKPSTLKAAWQELRKRGSGMLASFSSSSNLDPSGPSLDKSNANEDLRRVEAGLSRKAQESGRMGDLGEEDVEGIKWNAEAPSSTSASKFAHISLEFTNRTASFFCKVYYAEEFRCLRELIFPSGEDRFIRSLARCVKYDAKGGKSRSTFCKVVDDRFILKQIKSVEISSFEQIAPLYFEHVTKALEDGRPLVLTKILGVYSIGYRNTKTGSSKRLDVIIMENLLYGCRSSQVFDLKGSMRSRYIDPSKDTSSDVLLDENYLNYICNSPVYVYPHSKCVLMQAILADTEFLAQNSIMDYSLLTCIHEDTGELVVGIIDYVRTFTLDKRLEMYLKKTAGRVLPTVVYPELYRKRFCDAMERYFTVVPDKWTGLGASDH